MTEVIEVIKTLDWVTIGLSVLAIAGAIAAVTPTKKDDNAIARIKNLIGKK
jgi:hypothetical protein